MSHQPVLLKEVIANLKPEKDGTYLDGTFGAGGYSRAILEAVQCNLFAIDRDESAKKFAEKLTKNFPDHFVFLPGKFSESERLLNEQDAPKLDGMVFDIGVSSMQLDDRSRGFSFDSEAKLDMRMDQNSFPSAFEVVNESSEKELAQIIKEFGDEPKARQIAKKIIAARAVKPITTCQDLAQIVRSLYYGYSKTDPSTRTFQALRIFVNQELEELKAALASSLTLLKKGGRLVVVSFHSLEDKIVKDAFKEISTNNDTSNNYGSFERINKKVIAPSYKEVRKNPRSRSAKLRGLRRVL
jgi:16S rRNA (cytosine1402-N4)-methyltransferase